MKLYNFIIIFLITITACQNTEDKSNTKSNSVLGNSKEVYLRLNPTWGKAYYKTMEIESTPEGIVPIKSHSIIDLKMLPAQDVDDLIMFYLDFQRVQLEAGVLNQKISFDSQGDNRKVPNEIRRQIRQILSKNVTLQITPVGEITQIEFDGDKRLFDKSAINLSLLFLSFPKESISLDYSWIEAQELFDSKLTLMYTIREIKNDYITVHVSSDNHSEAEVSGEYLIHRRSGMIENADLSINSPEDIGEVKIKIYPTMR